MVCPEGLLPQTLTVVFGSLSVTFSPGGGVNVGAKKAQSTTHPHIHTHTPACTRARTRGRAHLGDIWLAAPEHS